MNSVTSLFTMIFSKLSLYLSVWCFVVDKDDEKSEFIFLLNVVESLCELTFLYHISVYFNLNIIWII